MHCCKDGEEKHAEHPEEKENDGKKAGMKEYLMAALVIGLLLFAVTTTAQVSQLKKGSGQNEGGQDAETYEEMMVRMHPEQAKSGDSMVGGC